MLQMTYRFVVMELDAQGFREAPGSRGDLQEAVKEEGWGGMRSYCYQRGLTYRECERIRGKRET